MIDYASMTVRQLRKLAPTLGVAGASRMTKDEILAALPRIFDRAARDALHRTPMTAYHPAGHLTSGARAASRFERRHQSFTSWQDDAKPVVLTVRRTRARIDRAATMVPATRMADGRYVPAVELAPPAQRRSALRRLAEALR